MATTKITITLPDEQIDSIRELVAAGKAGSLSGFIKHSVEVGLFDVAGWRAMLDDALEETGGTVTHDERKWADTLLHPVKTRAGGRRRDKNLDKRRAR